MGPVIRVKQNFYYFVDEMHINLIGCNLLRSTALLLREVIETTDDTDQRLNRTPFH